MARGIRWPTPDPAPRSAAGVMDSALAVVAGIWQGYSLLEIGRVVVLPGGAGVPATAAFGAAVVHVGPDPRAPARRVASPRPTSRR